MAAFLLSLREGLEAALIISILLGASQRLGRGEWSRFIWYGVATAPIRCQLIVQHRCCAGNGAASSGTRSRRRWR